VSRAAWRRHDVTRRTPHPNFFAERSRRIVGPLRQKRAEELWLLWTFAVVLLFEWEASTADPIQVAALMAPLKVALPRWHQKQFAGAIEDLMEQDELRGVAGAPEDFPVRLAATRWFCSLALPRTADDLPLGLPIFSPARVTGGVGGGEEA
jgi:hypothetical protein